MRNYIFDFNEFLLTEAFDHTVQRAQEVLKSKGYGNLLGTYGPNKDGVDGYAGPNTTAAVKKFQQDNSIQATGQLDNATLSKMGLSKAKAGDETTNIQKALKNKGYGNMLGTTGPNKDGVDGQAGPKTTNAIKKFQQDNGINPTGFVDRNTASLLGVAPMKMTKDNIPQFTYQHQPPEMKGDTFSHYNVNQKQIADRYAYLHRNIAQSKDLFRDPNVSEQVRRQLTFLNNNKLLANQKFTIVDDKNSIVYAINPNYQLYKAYPVITGEKVGDELAKTSMVEYIKDNWKSFFSDIFTNGFNSAVKTIEQNYFNLPEMKIKNTPAGVFKRVGVVLNWLYDEIATGIAEKTYGKRYVGFQTLDGKTIPFGFHGTENEARVQRLSKDEYNQETLSSGKSRVNKNNMSYGCINFKENDIIEISNFMESGDISIWLPDATNNILDPRTGQYVTS